MGDKGATLRVDHAHFVCWGGQINDKHRGLIVKKQVRGGTALTRGKDLAVHEAAMHQSIGYLAGRNGADRAGRRH